MSASRPVCADVKKTMKKEDWTAELFRQYLHAAASQLGNFMDLKNTDFETIEAREDQIRRILGKKICCAFRPWGENRFGAFGLFSKDGHGRYGKGEIWKQLAPERVLRAVAQRHETAKRLATEKKAADSAAAEAPSAQSGAQAEHGGQPKFQQEVASRSESIPASTSQPASLIIKLQLPRPGSLVSAATGPSNDAEASRPSMSLGASAVRTSHADHRQASNHYLGGSAVAPVPVYITINSDDESVVPQSLAQPSSPIHEETTTPADQQGARPRTTTSLGQQSTQSHQESQSPIDLVLAHLSSGGVVNLSPEFAGWKNIFRGFVAIQEDVSAMRLLQPHVLADAQTHSQSAMASFGGPRPMKRSWTNDEPADHSNTRSSPGRKLQRLSEQLSIPHLPSAAEQDQAFIVVENNEYFARDLQAGLKGKK